MTTFIGICAVILFLSLLIFIHELGHFWAAKRFGLLVEEFGFGLPPRAWGKKVGETIYSINWLPFGGFVKIFGENREDISSDLPQRTSDSPVPATGDHLRSHPASSVLSDGVQARRGSESFSSGDQKSFNVRVEGRGFSSLPIWKRVVVIGAGVFMNFLFGWIVLSFIFMIGIPEALLITHVQPGSPAAAAGVMPQDTIVHFSTVESFTDFVKSQQGVPLTLEIERQGTPLSFDITPRVNPAPGEGALGVGLFKVGLPQQGFFQAFVQGFTTSIQILQAIAVGLFDLLMQVFSGVGDFSNVTGPVGIVKVAADASSFGMVYLLQLLALISLNLAVLNVLPFPALDGGRLLFLLIEKLKGSPLPVRFEQYANGIGMALLLILMIVITVKDVRGLL